MKEEFEGYIVHPLYQTSARATRIFLVGRLSNGKTFAVIEEREKPCLYIRESDRGSLPQPDDSLRLTAEETGLSTIDGERCVVLQANTNQDQQEATRLLQMKGVRTYEADLRFYDQFFIKKQIFGSCLIRGEPQEGKHVDHIFVNPEISPSDWIPKLSVASIDIETNPESSEILSISVAFDNPWGDTPDNIVLFYGPTLNLDFVTSFASEKELLIAFRECIVSYDPDIITGWNVVEFDFKELSEQFRSHRVDFTIGRSEKAAEYLPGGKGQSSAVIIPGRQVIDGMRVMRSGSTTFDDNRLQTVAQAVLGEGKVKVSDDPDTFVGEEKIRALLRSYREDPETFCRYSMEDADLVLRILHKTGMMNLTILRALLTGIGLSRAWTSVAAFEFLYISSMHQRGLVAPTHGVDTFAVAGAAGGAIISPEPGFYDNVLVFDFKSLYPSIMRTFNIDPISYVSPQSDMKKGEMANLIQAPNGAYFRRSRAILPELLERFFDNRERAKKNRDENASYVYKIIMNSFYGVLGTPGCRFAASDIAGAITGFGHHLLHWCKGRIEEKGYRVIYGDTDSVFVLSGSASKTPMKDLSVEGEKIADEINGDLETYVTETWDVESSLELEFEAIYTKFFLPPMRGVSGQAGPGADRQAPLRGRAKGYAGMKIMPQSGQTVFDVKGMEAVRRDWTDAAKSVQINLLTMIFEQRPFSEVQSYLRQFIADLKAGKHDELLVYKKALRKPVEQYTRNRPPHVQAALALEKGQRKGVIEYVWTLNGPQPAKQRTIPIDYGHYIEKQLKPVALTILSILGVNADSLFDPDGQLELF